MAWVAVALLAGLIAPHSAAAQASPSQPSVGIRLVDAPADRTGDPRARIYIVDNLAPGSTIQRHIEVANATPNRLTIQLYAAGAQVDGGRFEPLDAHTANDLTGWTTITPSSIDLAPNTKGIATVDISVPPDTTGGERYAVIWAEPPPKQSGGVININRVGVRMYLSVAGAEPASDFTVSELHASRDVTGHQVVTATVTNTGGRAMDVVGQLQLARRTHNAGPFSSKGAVTVAPSQQATMSVAVRPPVARGAWQATLAATSGALLRNASGRLVFARTPETSAAGGYGWLLWVLIAVPVALVILGAILLARQRRGRRPARVG